MAGLSRILIVDDDPAIRSMVQQVLCGTPGSAFQCQGVGTFERCLEVCKSGLVDLILLDLGLPDSYGFDGLKTLREEYPQFPVMVLTGHDNPSDALRAVTEFGALAYITKPPKLEELYKAVSDALIRHASDKRIERKISKAELAWWIGILTSLVAFLLALLTFWEKIVQLFP